MYEIDGAFGKVRLGNFVFSQNAKNMLACFAGIGWHRCNELYGISRKSGYDVPLLLFTVDGMGTLRINSQEYSLMPGSAAVIPKGTPHEYFTPSGGIWEFYWAHPCGKVSVGMLDYFLNMHGLNLREGGVFFSSDIQKYTYAVESIMDYIDNGKTLSETEVCSMFSDIMYTLISDSGGGENNCGRLSGRVIRYLESHFAEHVSIDELSREFYISPAHLIRRFKKESGYTPYEYLGLIRLTKACRLLEFTEMPVGEISAAVGMPHTGRFIAKFKEYKGATPTVYRQRVKKRKAAAD